MVSSRSTGLLLRSRVLVASRMPALGAAVAAPLQASALADEGAMDGSFRTSDKSPASQSGMLSELTRTVVRISGAVRPASALASRLPGEQEQSINRLAAAVLILIYLGGRGLLHGDVPASEYATSAFYLAAAVSIFLNVRARPGWRIVRRWHPMLVDIGTLSFAQAAFGGNIAPLWPMYLWIILGYGLRHGVRYIWAATALSVFGFGISVPVSPYWSEQVPLATGLTIGMVIVPLYVGQLITRYGASTEKLDASNRAKAAILSSITYELRAPLRAVVALSDVLAGTHLDREQKAVVRTVGEAAGSVMSELDDLLDVSRLEADRMTVAPTAFRLPDLVAEAVGLTRAIAAAKGIVVAYHIAADAPLEVTTDRRHLRKILLSLMFNAVNFTRIGSVLLSVGKSGASPHGLRIEVTDTGIGISREEQRRIFEAYAQADNALLTEHRGSGLGLAVATQLVTLLGGTIGVRSRVERGSTFHFDVPVGASLVEPPGSGDMAGLAVAVISREPARVQELAGRLGKLGAATSVFTGADRLERLLADGAEEIERIAVLLDGQGEDAPVLAHAVRQASALGAVPLVLLAAAPGFPSLAEQRVFVTAVSAVSTDDELFAAFRIAAPRRRASQATLEGKDQSEGSSVAMAKALRRADRRLDVLVADGHRTTQILLARILEQGGHGATLVGDGDRVLEVLAKRDFDLALLDVGLPGVNGIDVAKSIRSGSKRRRHLPIFGLSASTDPETLARCDDALMQGCLRKPVANSELMEVVASVAEAKAAKRMEPPAPGVTSIASHPHYRAGLGLPVDAGGLGGVARVSGPAFDGPLTETFGAETEAIAGFLRFAVRTGDEELFREQLQALRGRATDIGARHLEALCLSGLRISREQLTDKGQALLDRLFLEVTTIRAGLKDVP